MRSSNKSMGLCLHRAMSAFAVLCGFLLFCNPLQAQSTYGQISGRVTDPQGGTVSGAKVRVTDQNTKVVREAETDAAGDFRIPNLNAGLYTMIISASGFAEAERKDVELLAREELRLDTSLTVASAAGQVVEVKATEAIVSDSNTISDSRTGQQISDLALNFRATDNPSPLNVARKLSARSLICCPVRESEIVFESL